MAGEVIDMFGTDGEEQTFGLGETVSAGPGGMSPPGPDPAPAGDAQSPMLPGPAIIQELDIALGHAKSAAHRLIELVAPGAIPEQQFEELQLTYATILSNVQAVAEAAGRAADSEALMTANRDAQQVLIQVQQYIEAVESVIGQTGGALAPPLADTQGGSRMLLWAALAGGVGAAGYGIWQLQKRRKKAKKK